jgi:hypothetical protein
MVGEASKRTGHDPRKRSGPLRETPTKRSIPMQIATTAVAMCQPHEGATEPHGGSRKVPGQQVASSITEVIDRELAKRAGSEPDRLAFWVNEFRSKGVIQPLQMAIAVLGTEETNARRADYEAALAEESRAARVERIVDHVLRYASTWKPALIEDLETAMEILYKAALWNSVDDFVEYHVKEIVLLPSGVSHDLPVCASDGMADRRENVMFCRPQFSEDSPERHEDLLFAAGTVITEYEGVFAPHNAESHAWKVAIGRELERRIEEHWVPSHIPRTPKDIADEIKELEGIALEDVADDARQWLDFGASTHDERVRRLLRVAELHIERQRRDLAIAEEVLVAARRRLAGDESVTWDFVEERSQLEAGTGYSFEFAGVILSYLTYPDRWEAMDLEGELRGFFAKLFPEHDLVPHTDAARALFRDVLAAFAGTTSSELTLKADGT